MEKVDQTQMMHRRLIVIELLVHQTPIAVDSEVGQKHFVAVPEVGQRCS